MDSILTFLTSSWASERQYDKERTKRCMPDLISHLKTGYLEVYKLYKECEELKIT